MPAKRYPVILDKCQRDYLIDLISSGRDSARKLTRARILLKADAGELGPAYTDADIKEAVEVSIPTIERTRKTFAREGLGTALTPKSVQMPQDRRSLMVKKKHISSPWRVQRLQRVSQDGRFGC